MKETSEQAIVDAEQFDPANKERWVARELAKVGQRYLVAMAMVFSAFYGIRGLGFLLSPGGMEGVRLGGVALLSSVVGFMVFAVARKRSMSSVQIEGAFVFFCLSLMFNTIWAYALKFNNELTPNFGFLMIAVGLGTISIRVWVGQLMLLVAGYGVVLLVIGPPDGRPFFFYLLSGAALSFLAFRSRITVVRERVAQDAELMDKARKLEAANKAKDRFLANMTHDLRTPMTGVLGMMDLLRDTRLTKEQSRLLDTAKTSAGYLLAIINDILDYSKMESGKFELKLVPTDAVAVTRDIVEMLRSQAQVKGIYLNVHLPDASQAWVKADGVRVGQILFNLIGNAIKFTEKGGVDVKLVQSTVGDAVTLEWQISDTGAGIPQERVGKLFERFEQLDSSMTRQQGGTGLGLAIIKELLDLMDGNMQVQSKVGEGTSFTFSIPLAVCAPPKAADARAPETETPAAKPEQRSLRVLVAEDNRINRALIEKLLQKQGWDVHMVENGEAAVAAVTKADQPFDLVLMDVQMPVMDGITATRILLDKMVSPPPIIALTANTMKDDVEAYMQAGMLAHVGKPIDVKQLTETVYRVLDSVQARKGSQ